MTSQPPEWPPRSSSREQSTTQPESSASIVRTTSEAVSTTSEDSTVILSNRTNIDLERGVPDAECPGAATEETHIAQPPNQPEARHCWICLQDEGEENTSTSEWKSPCPCNLQAHEECMLEWITDLETTSIRDGSLVASKFYCPQCKAEIKIQRPRETIVLFTDIVRRLARLAVFPAGVSAVVGLLYSGSMVYGVNTLNLVFGPQHAARILGGWFMIYRRGALSVGTSSLTEKLLRFLRTTDPFLPIVPGESLKVFLGLPLIAPALVLSRTRIAEHVFSIFPLGYFMLHHDLHGVQHWPPSPGLVFATLPYIRSVYNELYRINFSELEKKWDKTVMRKPREGETEAEVAQAQADAVQGRRNNIFELEIEVIQNVVEDEDDQNEDQNHNQNNEAEIVDARVELPPNVPLEIQNAEFPQLENQAPARINIHAADNPAIPAGVPPAAAAPGRGNDWEFRRNISTAQVATTVMGALFFPAVSSVMGDILKITLPSKWTTYQARFSGSKGLYASGLLQEKWGRSVVGGCLFVVLKDVLVLYCKWRKAQNQGKMKVLDYKGQRGAKAKK